MHRTCFHSTGSPGPSPRGWRPSRASRTAASIDAALSVLLAVLAVLLSTAPARAQAPDTVEIGPLVGVHWDGGRALAERVMAQALTLPSLPALPAGLLTAEQPVHVYFAPDGARFDSLTGGRAPEWGAGIAIPSRDMIVLPAYASDRGAPHELARTLRHELAHIALHRHLAPARPPRWFDEGFARIAAGEWDLEAAWQLRLAFATGNAPHLDSLALGWPRARHDARIAYLLSTTAVAYLLERGGENALGIFLQRWKDTRSLDSAMRRTYGLTLGQFEEDWRREVRDDYGWAYFLANTLVFWFFGGVLLLILYVRRRRRNLERLAVLRASEPPDSPAYWLGEGPAEGDEDASPEPPTP